MVNNKTFRKFIWMTYSRDFLRFPFKSIHLYNPMIKQSIQMIHSNEKFWQNDARSFVCYSLNSIECGELNVELDCMFFCSNITWLFNIRLQLALNIIERFNTNELFDWVRIIQHHFVNCFRHKIKMLHSKWVNVHSGHVTLSKKNSQWQQPFEVKFLT